MIWHMQLARMQHLGFPPPLIANRGQAKPAPPVNPKPEGKTIPGPFYGRSPHSPRTSHCAY